MDTRHRPSAEALAEKLECVCTQGQSQPELTPCSLLWPLLHQLPALWTQGRQRHSDASYSQGAAVLGQELISFCLRPSPWAGGACNQRRPRGRPGTFLLLTLQSFCHLLHPRPCISSASSSPCRTRLALPKGLPLSAPSPTRSSWFTMSGTYFIWKGHFSHLLHPLSSEFLGRLW